jgi:hypothetical protein
MNTQNIFALLFILVFFSCRKDEVVSDPAENYTQPCSFFPAHPGTWWTYDTYEGGNVTFEIDSYAHQVKDFYLPYFNNLDCYIKGCDFYHSSYSGLGVSGYHHAPIILETFGNSGFQTVSTVFFTTLFINEYTAGGVQSIDYRRELYTLDTTITNLNGQTFNNVLIMKEFNVEDSTHYFLEYFANNIGLIKRDSINSLDTTNLIEILTLNQYFINN